MSSEAIRILAFSFILINLLFGIVNLYYSFRTDKLGNTYCSKINLIGAIANLIGIILACFILVIER